MSKPFVAVPLLLLATLPAQGSINPSLLAPLKPTRSELERRHTVLERAVVEGRNAVVHVMVWVDRKPAFKIERPSSGVIVDPQGLVVTSWDLVREAFGAGDRPTPLHSLKVKLHTGDEYPAKLIAKHAPTGLVLLKIESKGQVFACLELADSNRAVAGEPAAVLSFHDGKENKVLAGVVVKACGGTRIGASRLKAEQILLTDAAIRRQSHGGALLDANGRLLGMVNAAQVQGDLQEPTREELLKPSFGFAVPAETLRKAFGSAFLAHKTGNKTLRQAQKPDAAEDRRRLHGPASAIAKVRDSIVSVWAGDGPRPALGDMDPYAQRRHKGLGSGVIIDTSGLVLTNAHLVPADGEVTVTLANGKSYRARVLKRHRAATTNVALLKMALGSETVKAIELGDSRAVIPGETVIGLGQPRGNGVLTVSAGVLSASRATPRVNLGNQKQSGSWLQSDATLDDRNGGGALIDGTGRLLGIINAGVVDKLEQAALRARIRKETSKLETGLHFVPGVNRIRQLFRSQLDQHAGSNESVARPRPASNEELALRSSAVTEVVKKTAGCTLNVYVAWSSKKADVENNPFAVAKPRIVTTSLGSGVIITRDGLAITNWHVVDSATEPTGEMRQDAAVYVRRRDGRRFDAQVLSISREDDLALLRLKLKPSETVDAIEFGDSDALQEGETVIAIGNPNGQKNTATVGVVTAKNQAIHIKGRWAKYKGLIQTDAAINGGNSGGGLLDINGKLIGINSAGGGGRRVTSYAIPVNHVRHKLRSLLLSPKKLRSIYVGMEWGDRDGHPLVITASRYGPARRAGIQPSDQLLALDGKPLTWSVGLTLQLLQKNPGQPLTFKVRRQGQAGPETRTLKLQPWSAATFAVYQQTGLECERLLFRRQPKLVRAAWTAMYDRSKARLTAIPESLVRIARARPGVVEDSKIRPGDLLLAVELRGREGSATTLTLKQFRTVAEVQACFNKHSNYDGMPFPCWVYRDGKVLVLQLTGKRLFY